MKEEHETSGREEKDNLASFLASESLICRLKDHPGYGKSKTCIGEV